MADSVWAPGLAAAVPDATATPRHSALVRVTHWITALCFFALLLSGGQIIISHPRFYWGETGNVLTQPLFILPIPASRSTVPTGYDFVLADQNGWSRYLHFQAAWALVFTGLVYIVSGLSSRHFRRNLLPAGRDLTSRVVWKAIAHHLRFQKPAEAEASSYNVVQRLAYLSVIFLLFPLMLWTGLAMSPAFTSAFPTTVTLLGGQQSARTIHFFGTVLLVLFLLIHIAMVYRAGFSNRVRAMITGQAGTPKEHP
jgi:thiosulfate reductase cytochrome b subunit